MNKKIVLFLVILLISVSLSGCLGRGGKGGQDEPVSSPDDVDGDDYNVLYIGHSFGRKFAELLEDYAHTAGETDHAQYIEFSGCLLYTSPSPRDLSTSRMPSSA